MRQMANVFLVQSLAIVLISTNVLLTKTFKGKAWGSQVKVTQLCPLFVTPWTNSPWNFPRQNTGVGSLLPSPGDLPNPGIEPRSPALQADCLPSEPLGKPWGPQGRENSASRLPLNSIPQHRLFFGSLACWPVLQILA